MIIGRVTSGREALIQLVVRGPGGNEVSVEVVIDTGFTDLLTLPTRSIAALGLPFAAVTRMVLGDGSEVDLEMFTATVIWDGQERQVLVLLAEGDPLVGMALLDGYRLTVDVEAGGAVLIDALV